MRYILLIVVVLGVLFACNMPQKSDTEKVGEGKIPVFIRTAYTGRSVFPHVSLDDVDHYALWGAPAGTAETALIPSFTQNASISLDAGTWDFTVRGYNGANALILQGERKNQAVSLSSNSFSFSLSPLLGGIGSILIAITLPSGSGVTMAAVFKDGGVETHLPVIDDRITYNAASVATGDYFYSFRLNNDAGNTLAVVSETVQVRDSLRSEKTITLTQADLNVPPSTPAAPVIEAGDGQLTVSWPAVPMIGDYEVYYSTTATPPAEPAETVANTTTTVISGLTNGTLYYVWIKAGNAAGTGGFSPAVNDTPIGTLGTSAVSASVGGLIISWTAVPGADSYNIYRSTSAGGIYSQVGTSSTTSYNDTGLSAATTYYYRVSAVNNSRESGQSDYVSGLTTPSVPIGVSAVTASSTRIMVSWTAVPGTDSYNIYRSTSASGTYSQVGTSLITSYNDTGLSSSVAYYYKVSAVNNSGESAQSSYANVTAYDALYGLSLNDALAWISSNAESGDEYIIELKANESIGPQTLSYSGKNVSISLNGGTSERQISLNSNGFIFDIGAGTTLILNNNITIIGRNDNSSSLVRVSSGAALVINEGTKITGNTTTSNTGSSGGGGGVNVAGGTFTMSGGIISGNTATAAIVLSNGGGVYITTGGRFTMSGGTISGNTAIVTGGYVSGSYGGGVNVAGGTFNMLGGTVSGNTATGSSSYGGGVFVNRDVLYYGSTFTKSGGGIIDSTNSANDGKVVYVSNYFLGTQKRNTTAGPTVSLDSSVGGSTGGWE